MAAKASSPFRFLGVRFACPFCVSVSPPCSGRRRSRPMWPDPARSSPIQKGRTRRGSRALFVGDGAPGSSAFLTKEPDAAGYAKGRAQRAPYAAPSDILLNITGASIGRCCMVLPRLVPARANRQGPALSSLCHQLGRTKAPVAPACADRHHPGSADKGLDVRPRSFIHDLHHPQARLRGCGWQSPKPRQPGANLLTPRPRSV